MSQLKLDFGQHISIHELTKPNGYKGLYGFHKYWGKKPAETVSFLIEQLSEPGHIVLDPFLGSGVIVREAFTRGRRVIAGDLNPAAIELASLLADPPYANEVKLALKELETKVRGRIDSSYSLADGAMATHYLWQENELRQVWTKSSKGKMRVELAPTVADLALIEEFHNYRPKNLRELRLFKNSRINSFENMQWRDLFSGRALRNLELLRKAILEIPDRSVKRALLMSLTAASGQMSKMVFAIEKRGKASGATTNGRIEVGSWVVGFWRPGLHFEINVWNCFANKAQALLRGLQNESAAHHPPRLSEKPLDVVQERAEVSLVNTNATDLLAALPPHSIDLIVTDPPHGDRIPYLELSEIWNAILDRNPKYEQEIVVSNAAERGHTSERYAERMKQVFQAAGRTLSATGRVAIMFNSHSRQEWQDLLAATDAGGFHYCGCFPMTYSAGSVVQDNRSGALRQDYVLIFVPASATGQRAAVARRLSHLPDWTKQIPIMKGQ